MHLYRGAHKPPWAGPGNGSGRRNARVTVPRAAQGCQLMHLKLYLVHTVALPPDFASIRTISLKKSQKALQTLTIIHLMHPEPFPVTRNAGMPGFRPNFATIRPSPDLLRSSQAPLAMGIAVDSCPAVQEKSPFSRFHNLPQHAEPSSRPTNAHKACHNHESALIMQGTW